MEIGDYRLEVVRDTEFWLDGGAMFGIVPRALWEHVAPPDEKNRIRLTTNCVFIDTGREKILIDTGIGEKWNAKEIEIYGINRKRPFAESLESITGSTPDDISIVINTHLHFDHAGGNTWRDPAGAVGLTFPRARYVVQARELEFARHTNERTAASYLASNFEGVPFTLVHGQAEPLPGIRCLPTPGHVPYHQSILLESKGERACFVADLVPTTAHLPLPWIMGYDLEPLVTLESKRRLYEQAEAEEWLLCFEHDPDMVAGRLAREGKTFGLVEPLRRG